MGERQVIVAILANIDCNLTLDNMDYVYQET